MYGFVNFALEQLVIRNFGEEIWTKIKYDIQGLKNCILKKKNCSNCEIFNLKNLYLK
jgi:hypothetical protein